MGRPHKKINHITRYYNNAKSSGNDTTNEPYRLLFHYLDSIAHRVCVLNKKGRPNYILQTTCNLLKATMLMLLERADSIEDYEPMRDISYYYDYIKNTVKDKLYTELDSLPPSNLAFLPMSLIEYAGSKEQQRATAYDLLLSDLEAALEIK